MLIIIKFLAGFHRECMYRTHTTNLLLSMYFNNNYYCVINSEGSSMMLMVKNDTSQLQNQQYRSNSGSILSKNDHRNGRMECSFCKNLPPERAVNYRDHWLKDNQKRVTCPILRAYNCPDCNNGGGDNAHTRIYCPLNRTKLPHGFHHRSIQMQQNRRFNNNHVSYTSSTAAGHDYHDFGLNNENNYAAFVRKSPNSNVSTIWSTMSEESNSNWIDSDGNGGGDFGW